MRLGRKTHGEVSPSSQLARLTVVGKPNASLVIRETPLFFFKEQGGHDHYWQEPVDTQVTVGFAPVWYAIAKGDHMKV